MIARTVGPPVQSTAPGRRALATEAPGAPSADQATRADRFRAAALPYLDDVYTLARFLLRNSADAEDAAQECYLRAYRHFDTFRGGPIKPWLFAILRNVCRAEFARRGAVALVQSGADEGADNASESLWGAQAVSPESTGLAQLDGDKIQRVIEELPEPFREVIVLREIEDMSYRDIADVVGAPIGTVMSRLARGRALLREAWQAEGREASR